MNKKPVPVTNNDKRREFAKKLIEAYKPVPREKIKIK